MPTLAAYARVSTARQAQSQSTEQQIERLQAYALAQGSDLVPEDIFRDDGYSGASLQRPGLDRLRDAAASARLDRILITAPDRLARNYVHQVLLVEELQKHGAEVTFLDRPMSQDPHDQLLLQIRGAVAEYERTLITERMRRGRLRRLKAGTLLPWTRAPYGYRLDPDRPRDPAGVRLDDAQATVVREIFAWYIEGTTIIALIKRLAQLGIPSPTGRPTWSPSALRCLLTNPTYTGQVVANRWRISPSQTRHSALRPVGRATGTRRAREPVEWITVAPVPALISREQFDCAAERLVYNRRMALRNNRVHQYLLRGLVSCGCCRCGCIGRRLPPSYDYYLCRTKSQLRLLVPGERCPARYIPARPLEELVWADLCEVLRHPQMIAHAMERARGGHWLPQEWQARRSNLQRGRASLVQQIERLTEAYLAGVVPLAEFERRRRETEGRLLALERQEQDLLGDIHRRNETASLAANADAFCRRVREGLETADFERKRALLELLVDRVIVTDGEVEIRYAFPTGLEGEREPFCRLRTDYQDRVPLPEEGRQVAPRAARADDPQHRFEEAPVVASAASRVRRLTQTMRRHLRPLGVRQDESVHPKLESRPSPKRNPESQQALL
jgi:site-specific DNA recombinase